LPSAHGERTNFWSAINRHVYYSFPHLSSLSHPPPLSLSLSLSLFLSLSLPLFPAIPLSIRAFDFAERKPRRDYILFVYVTVCHSCNAREQRFSRATARATLISAVPPLTRHTIHTQMKRRLLTVARRIVRAPSSRVSSELSEAVRQRSQRPVFAIGAFRRRHPDVRFRVTIPRYFTVHLLFDALSSALSRALAKTEHGAIAEATSCGPMTRGRRAGAATIDGRTDAPPSTPSRRPSPSPSPSPSGRSLLLRFYALRSRGPPAFSLAPSRRSRRDNAVADDAMIVTTATTSTSIPIQSDQSCSPSLARPPLSPASYCDVHLVHR